MNNYADWETSILVKKNRLLEDEIEKLKKENGSLKDMLINDHGACPDCIKAKLEGFTICGDCSC